MKRSFFIYLLISTCLIVTVFNFETFAQKKSKKSKPKVVKKSSSNQQLKDQPTWLIKIIDNFKKEGVKNPAIVITKFEYKNEEVYFIPSYCCDIRSTVLNAIGAVICSPDGGITGRGDGKCPDFYKERKNPVVIWKDERKR